MAVESSYLPAASKHSNRGRPADTDSRAALVAMDTHHEVVLYSKNNILFESTFHRTQRHFTT